MTTTQPTPLHKSLIKKAERMQEMLDRVRRQKGFESTEENPDFAEGEERVVYSQWIDMSESDCADYFTVLTSWVRGAFMMECILRLKGPFPVVVKWQIQELKTEFDTLYRGRYVASPSLYL